MNICNEPVTRLENEIDFGFFNILKDKYVDLTGEILEREPEYWTYYGLSSYTVIGHSYQAKKTSICFII